jgi:rsbT co-antagonist protein RsbR
MLSSGERKGLPGVKWGLAPNPSQEEHVMADHRTRLAAIMRDHEAPILADWTSRLAKSSRGALDRAEVEEQARAFVRLLGEALGADGADGIEGPAWAKMRDLLASLSASRARQGFTPSETATFVFSLKEPLFTRLREEYRGDGEGLARELWTATLLLDKLGLLTTELFRKTREDVIVRQQRELLELSTPVVALWEGILAVPLIGTLDSERTQVVMESLLQRIVDTGASIAIIDITGVPTVDTLVAQHLLKTVSAARLMGAECIISGIRPQIAQTIVHLGVDLGNVATKATLADALILALARVGAAVTRTAPRA